MNIGNLKRYLSGAAEDAAPTMGWMPRMTGLAEHDARFHGGNFDPKTQTCGLREAAAKADEADSILGGAAVAERDDRKVCDLGFGELTELLDRVKPDWRKELNDVINHDFTWVDEDGRETDVDIFDGELEDYLQGAMEDAVERMPNLDADTRVSDFDVDTFILWVAGSYVHEVLPEMNRWANSPEGRAEARAEHEDWVANGDYGW